MREAGERPQGRELTRVQMDGRPGAGTCPSPFPPPSPPSPLSPRPCAVLRDSRSGSLSPPPSTLPAGGVGGNVRGLVALDGSELALSVLGSAQRQRWRAASSPFLRAHSCCVRVYYYARTTSAHMRECMRILVFVRARTKCWANDVGMRERE